MRQIPTPLDKVLRLQGILFRWSQAGLDHFTRGIEEQVSAGPGATPDENQRVWDEQRTKTREANSGDHVGLIAQEVETVLPELDHEDKEGYKHIRYQQLTALLVEAIKEQNAMIRKLSEKARRPGGGVTSAGATATRPLWCPLGCGGAMLAPQEWAGRMVGLDAWGIPPRPPGRLSSVTLWRRRPCRTTTGSRPTGGTCWRSSFRLCASRTQCGGRWTGRSRAASEPAASP